MELLIDKIYINNNNIGFIFIKSRPTGLVCLVTKLFAINTISYNILQTERKLLMKSWFRDWTVL